MRQEDKSSVRRKNFPGGGERESLFVVRKILYASLLSSKAPPRRVLAFLCSLAVVGHKRRGTHKIELGRFLTILV